MEINYWAVLACALASMILGSLWYGPLFGKKWMELNGVDPKDKAHLEKMRKSAGPLYLIQFLLTLFSVYVLAHFIAAWKDASGVTTAMWIWIGFVIPTLAAAIMWTSESTKGKWTRFFIQSGYQLLLFVVFGLILGYWA